MAKTDIRKVHSNFGYRNCQNELLSKSFPQDLEFLCLGEWLARSARFTLSQHCAKSSRRAARRFLGPNL